MYTVLKQNKLTYYVRSNLIEDVKQRLNDIQREVGTLDNLIAELYVTRMSDFVVNNKNEFVKCRYDLHDMIETYEKKLCWLRRVNDE